MTNFILAAGRLPFQTLLTIGALGGAVIMMLAFSNWRLAVKSALIIALFEGALRKWVFPSGQELMYLLKDIVLAGAYIRFFFFPDAELRAWRFNVPVGFMLVLVCIVCFSALNPNIGSAILSIYGVKIYFFYLPLAFMIPHLFRSEDEMVRQLCNFAFLATPICLLGVAQFGAGQDSWLNMYADSGGAGTEGVSSFGWGGARTRITGTFSYIAGHAVFVSYFSALHLFLLSCNLTKWRTSWLILNIPLLVGNAFMNGSRANILVMTTVLVVFVVISLNMKIGERTGMISMLIVAALIGAVGVTIYFADAMNEWSIRWRSSDDGVRFRVLGHQVDSLEKAINEAGLTGYGIGMAHPAPERLRSVMGIPPPKRKAPVFDSEPGQIYGELGPAGFLAWMMLRCLMVLHALQGLFLTQSLRLKALLAAALALQLIQLWFGSVYNHTAHLFIFTLYGFALIPFTVPKIVMKRRLGGARGQMKDRSAV